MKSTSLQQFISDFMDDLADMPPDKFRAIFPERRHPKGLDFEKTIGKTTYIVTSSFNQKTSEDMFNKVIRMIESDMDDSLCEVSAVFVGIDCAALDSAKEMLISAYVKNLIAKGNSNDNS